MNSIIELEKIKTIEKERDNLNIKLETVIKKLQVKLDVLNEIKEDICDILYKYQDYLNKIDTGKRNVNYSNIKREVIKFKIIDYKDNSYERLKSLFDEIKVYEESNWVYKFWYRRYYNDSIEKSKRDSKELKIQFENQKKLLK